MGGGEEEASSSSLRVLARDLIATLRSLVREPPKPQVENSGMYCSKLPLPERCAFQIHVYLRFYKSNVIAHRLDDASDLMCYRLLRSLQLI